MSFRDELSHHWNILVAAVIGIGLGAIALPTAAISIFMRDIQSDFGWSRTAISLTSTVTISGLALSAPLVGWLADRYPIQRIVGFSMAAMAGFFLILSRAGDQLLPYMITFGIMALLAAGASTVPYARIVSLAFTHNRGKALGLAMVGNGLSGIGLPLLLVPLVDIHGWRSGFVALALIALIAMAVIVGLLRGAASPVAASSSTRDSSASEVGFTLREALSSQVFRRLAASFLLAALAAAGLQLHFVSILGDNGLSAASIAWYASSIGVVLAITRVGTGFLLDLFPAQIVSATVMGIGAIAVGGFALTGPGGAPLGAVAIGLTVGAEIDMIGYFTSRYFGFVAYGRVYGLLYATVLVGSAISPLLYGTIKDQLGNYDIALFGSILLLLICAALLLTLRRHPYPTAAATPSPTTKHSPPATITGT
ncbi:MFS transporter [Rhodococcus opacus]|uniref:MFS transporter n=1 Tax=Rhodococcus opacus TaxID=37919 RepID=A0AAX3YQX0_RHOOP|nr:MFS transporter [Rhodococcus opacus]MCZ4587612.1 MFS transporter [Rhodococcus opacus]WLF51393.1 MFS transporter [Rhodococcus opacus]